MKNREDGLQARQDRIAQYKLTLYIVFIAFVSTTLCAINAAIVFALIKGLEPYVSHVHGIQQILQFTLALAPVLLLFGEWRAWDIVTAKRNR